MAGAEGVFTVSVRLSFSLLADESPGLITTNATSKTAALVMNKVFLVFICLFVLQCVGDLRGQREAQLEKCR
jgi:hypothetical protein